MRNISTSLASALDNHFVVDKLARAVDALEQTWTAGRMLLAVDAALATVARVGVVRFDLLEHLQLLLYALKPGDHAHRLRLRL